MGPPVPLGRQPRRGDAASSQPSRPVSGPHPPYTVRVIRPAGLAPQGSRALTDARQSNAVSEGVALGLLALGHTRVEDDPPAIDSAFARAWVGWSLREGFPRVSYDVDRGDRGLHVVTRARLRTPTGMLYWSRVPRYLQVTSRLDGWLPSTQGEFLIAAGAIEGGVPLPAWRELAEAFLEAFRPPPGSHDLELESWRL